MSSIYNDTEKGKNRFKFFYIVLIFCLAELAIVGTVGYSLIQMAVVPNKYLIIALVGLIVFNTLLLLSSKKIWTGIIMIIFTCVLSVGMLYVKDVLTTVDDTIKTVTENAEEQITEMAIVVLADSEIHQITDLSQFIISYVNDDDYEYAQKLMAEIDANTGGKVKYIELENTTSMVGALYAKTVDALIINKAYIEMIKDIEGYEDFSERTKIIYSSDIISYIDLVEVRQPKNEGTFIVYISGIDKFGAVQAKSRSDVNILAVVNTNTKHIQLINTPRDYYIIHSKSKGKEDKLTHAGLYGVKSSIRALENLYGIEIDYYVRMNFSGFESIIDALGGIDVYSEYDFTVEPIKHYVVGTNHLTGLEALAFARERKSFASGDIQRGKNQMAVIIATINKMTSTEMLYNYTSVLESISGSFQTNMQSEEIYALVRQQLEDGRGWTIDTYSVNGQGALRETYSMPGTELSVKLPDEASVNEAKNLITNILNEK